MMDVAGMAGVSQATVSLVLNGSAGARLTPATRRRVKEAAETLGYEFVRRGSRSKSGVPSTIIFIADESTTDPWMALAFEGARDKALELGINTFMTVSHGDADIEAMIVTHFGRFPVLGFLYGTTLTRLVHLPLVLSTQRTVLVNCYDKTGELASVLPADLPGGRTATERLLQSGCRRIGFINGQQGVDASRDRLQGYKQALSSYQVPFDPRLVRSGNWEPSSGYEMTRDLMTQGNPPDAIFCANDMMALGCFDALNELGIKVPDDLSVIGFDDREIAQQTHPPLTTILLPHYEMGAIAAQELIDGAGRAFGRVSQMKVHCPLVERQSVIGKAADQ